MKKLLFLALLSLLMPLAAEEAPEKQEGEEQKTETSASDETPAPQAGNLRNRELGDAFRNFQPSEEISADNAVSFPVDI
ncbi:MAG: hypothetical protein ISP91_11465 [Pseudomonadales bacterium]|jgi:hypothetical protein|nr:hypothetical protein [Pseudomonadales bacterium]